MAAVNRFRTYGLVSLCGVGVAATIDNAFGLGGSAFLADICMTILEGDTPEGEMGGMADMPMEIKPVPLIALSLTATAAAIYGLTRDHQRFVSGKSEPDDQERAAILSAMLLVSRARGRVAREEVLDVFRIVTSHDLDRDLLELTLQRFQNASDDELERYRFPPMSSSIARRRTLAAALMVGCVARPATSEVSALIERIGLDIGASSEDVSAARTALHKWQKDCTPANGVSLVTLLRHRSLDLAPA